ncbi:MAG: hypothetical protein KKA79_03115 [Nanoarchaeota archaeon]|nr:hypothetical protein [Nanoarchaeota archaeon]
MTTYRPIDIAFVRNAINVTQHQIEAYAHEERLDEGLRVARNTFQTDALPYLRDRNLIRIFNEDQRLTTDEEFRHLMIDAARIANLLGIEIIPRRRESLCANTSSTIFGATAGILGTMAVNFPIGLILGLGAWYCAKYLPRAERRNPHLGAQPADPILPERVTTAAGPAEAFEARRLARITGDETIEIEGTRYNIYGLMATNLLMSYDGMTHLLDHEGTQRLFSFFVGRENINNLFIKVWERNPTQNNILARIESFNRYVAEFHGVLKAEQLAEQIWIKQRELTHR